MNRLCHISDTHGKFPNLFGNYNIVVHSGDFFPDPPGNPRFKDQIGGWQLDWLKENIYAFKLCIKESPFLFTLGNHDFADPYSMEELLKENDVNATCLHDDVIEFNGIKFYGFPYIPYINGGFAYEEQRADMKDKLKFLVSDLNKEKADVLVCHAPPKNILDLSYRGDNLGIHDMEESLLKIKVKNRPSHYLSGHIHHAKGLLVKHNILFSNAATGQHILEI